MEASSAMGAYRGPDDIDTWRPDTGVLYRVCGGGGEGWIREMRERRRIAGIGRTEPDNLYFPPTGEKSGIERPDACAIHWGTGKRGLGSPKMALGMVRYGGVAARSST